jgi:hypothetical protein
MTLRKLCSKIARVEGLKHQASIGDVREIVGIISDELYNLSGWELILLLANLVKNGERRSKVKK